MTPIRAVLFDLDGTLYHQPPLRALMAAELALRPWFTMPPAGVRRLWRMLRVFRQSREELRAHDPLQGPLESLQYSVAAERSGSTDAEMRDAVREWMFERPLRYLRSTRRPGALNALRELRAAGVQVGVFSDYPARQKLDALDLGELVSLELCATDADVNAFKPHPRGFRVACERWALQPNEVLYVGDRTDVDAAGAAASGMPCAIIGAPSGATWVGLRRLDEIPRLIHPDFRPAAPGSSGRLENDAHHAR